MSKGNLFSMLYYELPPGWVPTIYLTYISQEVGGAETQGADKKTWCTIPNVKNMTLYVSYTWNQEFLFTLFNVHHIVLYFTYFHLKTFNEKKKKDDLLHPPYRWPVART